MSDVLRIVSVSGGKDSTALYCWAIEQFGKDGFTAIFADTDHEHPVTLNYVRNLPTMAGGPEIVWVRADFASRLAVKNQNRIAKGRKPVEQSGNRFLDMMLWKGRAPGGGRGQFCTTLLKLEPIREHIESIRDDREVEIYLGIRAAESRARAALKEREFSDYNDGYINRPLLRWSEAEVFDYLEAKTVPPNPLYGIGMSRVGCFPCIHANKQDLRSLPDWAWDKIIEWEKRLGRTFFPPGLVPGVDIVTANDARAWSKTTRGGRQTDLLAIDAKDVPSCMSTWGACE